MKRKIVFLGMSILLTCVAIDYVHQLSAQTGAPAVQQAPAVETPSPAPEVMPAESPAAADDTLTTTVMETTESLPAPTMEHVSATPVQPAMEQAAPTPAPMEQAATAPKMSEPIAQPVTKAAPVQPAIQQAAPPSMTTQPALPSTAQPTSLPDMPTIEDEKNVTDMPAMEAQPMGAQPSAPPAATSSQEESKPEMTAIDIVATKTATPPTTTPPTQQQTTVPAPVEPEKTIIDTETQMDVPMDQAATMPAMPAEPAEQSIELLDFEELETSPENDVDVTEISQEMPVTL